MTASVARGGTQKEGRGSARRVTDGPAETNAGALQASRTRALPDGGPPRPLPGPRRPHSEFALSHRLSSHLCPRPLRPPVCGLRGPGQREALAAGPLHPVLSPPVVCEFLFFFTRLCPKRNKRQSRLFTAQRLPRGAP